ncbi:PTC2 [Candida oxycetoniae]|uniref:protein-serine/threonine phosphatase n=1 Tax=Candida oxycetoniae TaxID=497107 RepID=A0AAI9WX81_9ASCO|nr:PTC2 [Candida oxycetoniae]KAI3404036.2 PTC2 [Candida oxycetoniae]
MGQILSHPVVEKHTEDGHDKFLAYGLSSMQGWRVNMEDAHATILNLSTVNKEDDELRISKDNGSDDGDDGDDGATDDERNESETVVNSQNEALAVDDKVDDAVGEVSKEDLEHVAFFGVYDGHGGEKAAIFTGKHLHHIIMETAEYKKKDYVNALKQGFLNCDEAILKDVFMKNDESGCAATSAIITPKSIICGNAGDSRTVMSINGFAKPLSYDHKPSNEGEKTRINAAGGYVDMGRVNGNLALSRGIGDFDFKKNADLPAEEQIVTCFPDVISHEINYEDDEFVVLACDGIWDCLTSQKCVECIRRGIYERKPLTQICEEMMDLCCAPTSDGSGIGCDNMSIVIVALLNYAANETIEEWYQKIINKIEIAQEEVHYNKTEVEDSDHDYQHPQPPRHQQQAKYGSISEPYEKIYKGMYGYRYEMGSQFERSGGGSSSSGGLMNGNSIFGSGGYDEEEGPSGERDDDDEDDEHNNVGAHGRGHPDSGLNSGAISLSKLLSSNALTNENGVIYLDTSSAQSLLAHFGVGDTVHREDVDSAEEEGEERDTDEVDGGGGFHRRSTEENETNQRFEEVHDDNDDNDEEMSETPKSD